jgi:hypothetical protein
MPSFAILSDLTFGTMIKVGGMREIPTKLHCQLFRPALAITVLLHRIKCVAIHRILHYGEGFTRFTQYSYYAEVKYGYVALDPYKQEFSNRF